MSEIEFYKGILTLIGENAEEKAKKILYNKGLLVNTKESYVSQLLKYTNSQDEIKYYQNNGKLYEIERKECDDFIFEAKRKNNLTIDFTLRYYNGGCGFLEALGKAMENIKQKGE